MPNHPAADQESARTDAEAKARFLRFLNLSLSAITETAQWIVAPPAGSSHHHTAVTVPDTICLRTVDDSHSWFLRSTLQFTFGEHPDFPPERKVFTENYAHTLSMNSDLKPALFSWEWDPDGHHDAHVHVGRSIKELQGFGKFHIPTARIRFEHVLRFALHDLGVLPNRRLGSTDDERMSKAWAIVGESLRRAEKYGRKSV